MLNRSLAIAIEPRMIVRAYRLSARIAPSSTQAMLVFVAPMSTIQAEETPTPKVTARLSCRQANYTQVSNGPDEKRNVYLLYAYLLEAHSTQQ